MGLTVKQDNFCIEYLKDGNATRAYKTAYNCEKLKNNVISVKASELLKNGKITVRLKELKTQINTYEIDTLKIIRNFWVNIIVSENQDVKLSDRLKASELLARCDGLFKNDKPQNVQTLNIVTKEDILNAINETLGS